MSSGIEIVTLAERVFAKWYEKSGLLAAMGIVLVAGAWLSLSFWPTIISVASAWCVVGLLWYLMRRPPRAAKNRVGIAIVISPPDTAAERTFAADFVNEIRRLLQSGKVGPTFQVIIAPSHIAAELQPGDSGGFESLRRHMRCMFLLAGSVRVRKLNGKDHLVLDLMGVVAHKPIPDAVRQQFSREFTELLPRRITLPSDQDLLAFTFTGEWASLVAKYVIGIAAALSGDVDYAQSLYESVQEAAAHRSVDSPVAAKIVSRLPQRFAELHEARANASFKAWQSTRKLDDAKAIKAHLDQIDSSLLTARRYSTLRAIAAFVVDGDADGALKLLEPMRREADGVWYWNVGFLYAHKGNLKKASQLYRSGALAGLPPDVPAQLEEFMTWVMHEDPSKVQIHYCLGLLNRDVKGDADRAKEEFQDFLRLAPPAKFEREKELVAQWIDEIDSTR